MRLFLLLILPLLLAADVAPPAYLRLLFIGNSITFNEPAPGEPYYWLGRWGENASAAHLDYVHQVWAGIAARQGSVPAMQIVSAIYVADIQAAPDAVAAYNADLIVVQWGEAAPHELTQAEWDTIYRGIAEAAGEAKMLAVGMWGTRPIGDRDVKLRSAALAAGMAYVPVADLHTPRTPEMCVGLHPGVCRHPFDNEMAAIANRILAAIYSQDVYLPVVHGTSGGTVPPGK